MRSARTTPKATKEKRSAVRTIRLIFSRALMNANPPTNDLRIVDTERKQAAPAYSRSRIRIMSCFRKVPLFLANSIRQINEVTLICPLSSAGELSRRCAQSFRLGNRNGNFRCRALSEGIRVMLAPNKGPKCTILGRLSCAQRTTDPYAARPFHFILLLFSPLIVSPPSSS